ncbi:hypothetical protein [Pedobacter frigiditerrae]|uniref:hypothetical protein n=1 Tax=Pedobacter frigiditerrae TaxID=2530452 RepID=UPI00292E4857|nr:hypothetical protein [Pedobacter frigiditerrae]
MKKLTILFFCIATLGLASCKKDTIVNQTTPNITVIRDVPSSAWTLSSDKLTYYTTLNVQQINKYSLDNDAILVYISYDSGATYLQMPFVYNVDAFSTVISEKQVEIDIQSSDNQDVTPIKPTGTTRVKIVIVASDIQ